MILMSAESDLENDFEDDFDDTEDEEIEDEDFQMVKPKLSANLLNVLYA